MQTKAEYLRAWRSKNPQKVLQYKANERYKDYLKYKQQKEQNQRKDVINGKSKG